ncbi:IS3 family transposase [Streptomyces caelestis]|uniref:IS3 family transposase n=1 Tax=Streptomyces TaxID=1883 RepID=UPI000A5F805A|nr:MULTISPECIES: IS3 family transposase [Streptomyces]
MTALLDEHEHLEVEPTLRELHISSSTYYRWRRAEKEPCERRRRDTELAGRIQQIHTASGGIYGSPRVHAVLKREGVHVGRKRVERLMCQAALAGISPGGARASPAAIRTRNWALTWSGATSPRTCRTGCGSPT